ncbi:MAG: malate synthase G, partial [Thiothrix sp.]
MIDRVAINGLQVSTILHEFVNNSALPGTGLTAEAFWSGLAAIVNDLAPRNRALLAKRDALQAQIDAWHVANRGKFDFAAYKAFLQDIGYLLPEGEAFQVSTSNVDTEITATAGPQLVVPVMNARFALNAANARWGSLYDALYGTDAIPHTDGAVAGQDYNPVRGKKVIEFARNFLDEVAPLSCLSHRDATHYRVDERGTLTVDMVDGAVVGLRNPQQFVGYRGERDAPSAILLRNNGLHFEIQIDRNARIGKSDAAGINDILMEAALTTIMDCEDSVAAVDAADKVVVYRNWLGLMKGDLTEQVTKAGKTFTRAMNPDREYTGVDGKPLTLPGRSL